MLNQEGAYLNSLRSEMKEAIIKQDEERLVHVLHSARMNQVLMNLSLDSPEVSFDDLENVKVEGAEFFEKVASNAKFAVRTIVCVGQKEMTFKRSVFAK